MKLNTKANTYDTNPPIIPLMTCPAECDDEGEVTISQRKDAPELFSVTCTNCGAHATVCPTEALTRKLKQVQAELDLFDLCDGYIRAENERIRLKQERQWIPCSERMPERGQKVLTYCGHEFCQVDFRDIGSEWAKAKYSWYQPTHWMPLPELPEEEKRL